MSSRLQRWALTLSQYDYNIVHVKGTDNVPSDFLSRLPIPQTENIEEPAELVLMLEHLTDRGISCEDIKKHVSENIIQRLLA